MALLVRKTCILERGRRHRYYSNQCSKSVASIYEEGRTTIWDAQSFFPTVPSNDHSGFGGDAVSTEPSRAIDMGRSLLLRHAPGVAIGSFSRSRQWDGVPYLNWGGAAGGRSAKCLSWFCRPRSSPSSHVTHCRFYSSSPFPGCHPVGIEDATVGVLSPLAPLCSSRPGCCGFFLLRRWCWLWSREPGWAPSYQKEWPSQTFYPLLLSVSSLGFIGLGTEHFCICPIIVPFQNNSGLYRPYPSSFVLPKDALQAYYCVPIVLQALRFSSRDWPLCRKFQIVFRLTEAIRENSDCLFSTILFAWISTLLGLSCITPTSGLGLVFSIWPRGRMLNYETCNYIHK